MQYKMYRIKWLDSASSYGWVLHEDVKRDALEVDSIAFLIQEHDNQFIFSAHIAHNCIDAPMCIPKIAITLMEEIKDAISQREES